MNITVLSGIHGTLRIGTIVTGILTFSLTASAYENIEKEEFFLGIAIISCLISLIWLILLVMDVVKTKDSTKTFDTAFHLITGFLLLIAAIIWLVSVVELWNICERSKEQLHTAQLFGLEINSEFDELESCQISWKVKRVGAAIFGILDSLLYLGLGLLLLKSHL